VEEAGLAAGIAPLLLPSTLEAEGYSALYAVEPGSPAWSSLIRGHPDATVFHQPEWAQVLEAAYGFRPRYFLLRHRGGGVSGIPLFEVGGLGKRGKNVSLPFSDVGGPLLSPGQDPSDLVAVLLDVMGEGVRLELRMLEGPELPGFSLSEEFCTFVIDLDADAETLRKRFQKSSTQRSIKAAERGPLKVRHGRSEADMRAFYRLNLLTRRRHGVPPQPYRFFSRLWESLAPAGMLTLLLAEVDQKPAAGMIVLHSGQTHYYKYGASDPGMLFLRPNHLLMWEAIRLAVRAGVKRFDLGRTWRGNASLLRFKKSWGAREVPLRYWTHPPRNGSGGFAGTFLSEGGLGYALIAGGWRRLPLPLTRLGGAFYKLFA